MIQYKFVDSVYESEYDKEVIELAKISQVMRATRSKFRKMRFVLAFDDDKLVGFANYYIDLKRGKFELYQIGIEPTYIDKIRYNLIQYMLSKNVDRFNCYVSCFSFEEKEIEIFKELGFKKKSQTKSDGVTLLRLVKSYRTSTEIKVSADQMLFDHDIIDCIILENGYYYNMVETIPMVNVIDRRKGEYKTGRKYFKDIIDFKNQGRPDGITYGNLPDYVKGNFSGTSIHCPYLTFNVYQYFSRKGDSILDPFAGGIPRGLVAERMDRRYTGIDCREEQIESNIEICNSLGANPKYIVGDSDIILDELEDNYYELAYTSPPFWGCEIYSDHKDDISNYELEEFNKKYVSILKKTAKKIKNMGNFLIEVGDGRQKDGYYTLQPELTAQTLFECGLKLYNRFVIIDPLGTKAYTSRRSQENGKFTGSHKIMYHFIK